MCKVLWKITPRFANWLAAAAVDNPLHAALLTPTAIVLELGCGISALIGLAIGPKVARVVLTDQTYVSKLVAQNLAENPVSTTTRKPKGRRTSVGNTTSNPTPKKVVFTPLDWELDSPTPSLTGSPSSKSFDLVLACDCIYNDTLVRPFVQTCVEACRLRDTDESSSSEPPSSGRRPRPTEPSVCLVAQQLRDPDVFTAWLREFCREFCVWRVPDELLSDELKGGSGFVVHLGILKGAKARCLAAP
jgi:hypothetical protein